MPAQIDWPLTLFTVWIAGALAFWTVMLYRYVWAVRLLGKGRIMESGPLVETLDSLRKQLGVRSRPRIVLSNAVGSPFLWGLWRPSIALPAEFPGEMSATELETVLLHELMHLKRGDLFITHLELFVQGIFWFHPLVWGAAWNLRRERESACDEAVLATGCIEAKRYGDSLVNVLDFVRDRSPLPVGFLGVTGIFESKTQLQQRLEEIMTQHKHVRKIGLFGWGMLLFFALCILPMAVAKYEAPASEKPTAGGYSAAQMEEERQYVAGPMEGIAAVLASEDGYIVVKNLIPDGPAFKSGLLKENDKIIGVGQGKEGSIEDVVGAELADVIKRIRGPKGTVVRLKILPADGSGEKTIEIVRDATKDAVMAANYTHLVFFQPVGDFNPRNPGQFFPVFRDKFVKEGPKAEYFRTKPVDGKLIGSFCTDDPEGLERIIKSIPEIEFIRSEQLTKEMFEEHEKTPPLSLPSPPSPRLIELQKTDWYQKLNAGQQRWLAEIENNCAYVYDPKNYEVGNDKSAFIKKWVRLLEGPEAGFPGRETLHPYDEAIFGLATHKSDKALKLLVKIATERVVKDNAHRQFATTALGMLGDPAAVPELIPLLYHYNTDTRWNAQISLVQLTGQNFGRDADAWGKWYNANRDKLGKGLPVFDPTPVDWTCGSKDPDILRWSDPKYQEERDNRR